MASKSWSQLVSNKRIESQDNENKDPIPDPMPKTSDNKFVSLDEVMSEQLALKLDEQDFKDDIKLVTDIGAIGGQPVSDLPMGREESIRKFIEESGLDMSQVQQMLDNNK